MAFKKKNNPAKGGGAGTEMPAGQEQPSAESQPEREESSYKVNGREGPEAGAPKLAAGSVSIKLAEDGSADPSTRESTWSKLKTMLDKTPEARARLLGGKSGAALIEPKHIEPFYSGIGLINTFLAIKLMHLQAELAQAFIPYTEDKKNDDGKVIEQGELSILSEATAEAINENIDKVPPWFRDLLLGGGNVAFAKLAMVLFQVHAQKLTALRAALKPEAVRPAAVN